MQKYLFERLILKAKGLTIVVVDPRTEDKEEV